MTLHHELFLMQMGLNRIPVRSPMSFATISLASGSQGSPLALVDMEVLAKATLTSEEEQEVRRGWCPKCIGRSLRGPLRIEDMQFLRCAACESTYCLPVER